MISFFGFWILDGQRFSFSRINQEQESVKSGSTSSSDRMKLNEVLLAIHPYLGFVYDPKANDKDYHEFVGHPINDFGFVDANLIQKRAQGKVIIGITGGSVAYIFHRLGAHTLEEELKKCLFFK